MRGGSPVRRAFGGSFPGLEKRQYQGHNFFSLRNDRSKTKVAKLCSYQLPLDCLLRAVLRPSSIHGTPPPVRTMDMHEPCSGQGRSKHLVGILRALLKPTEPERDRAEPTTSSTSSTSWPLRNTAHTDEPYMREAMSYPTTSGMFSSSLGALENKAPISEAKRYRLKNTDTERIRHSPLRIQFLAHDMSKDLWFGIGTPGVQSSSCSFTVFRRNA